MYLVKAEENQIEKIVAMSVRAFETDVNVGGIKGDLSLDSPLRGGPMVSAEERRLTAC